MRDIKFRAWDTQRNRMWAWRDINISPVMGNSKRTVVYLRVGDEWRPDGGLIAMQYVGRKDSNGREIYEGDVLYYVIKESTSDFKDDTAVKRIVDWRDGAFVDKHTWNNIADELEEWKGLEVIGNIYENPDLLK